MTTDAPAMQIDLDLTHHCIETELRRRHETAMGHYFRGRADKNALETELVLLEQALRAFDFGRLRARWPILAGGDRNPAALTRDDAGHPCLRFAGRSILPPADASQA